MIAPHISKLLGNLLLVGDSIVHVHDPTPHPHSRAEIAPDETGNGDYEIRGKRLVVITDEGGNPEYDDGLNKFLDRDFGKPSVRLDEPRRA